MEQNVVLCGANSYDQKYYLNQEFSALPDAVKQELQIMCVWFTEDIGGILTLEFEPDGTLIMKTTADDMDYYYDDIGAGLKLHQLQLIKGTRMASEYVKEPEASIFIQLMNMLIWLLIYRTSSSGHRTGAFCFPIT